MGHDVHGEWENIYVPANIKPDGFVPLISQPHIPGDVFTDYVAYLRRSNALIRKTYEIQKQGGFKGAGSPEALQFTDERLAAAASMLRDMIYTAWINSASPPAGKPLSPPQAPAR